MSITTTTLWAELRPQLPLLAEQIEAKAGLKEDYDAFFLPGIPRPLTRSKTTVRCHLLAFDGNGALRVDGLARHLRTLILSYCIPQKELQLAIQSAATTRSPHQLLLLEEKAALLFTDIANSGEGGEMLLFFLATRVLRLPPLLCKMALKTNPRMHFHGADGVYVGADQEQGHLCIYFGESKLHERIATAASECMASLAKLLANPEAHASPASRDLWLIRDHIDLGDASLEESLKKFLNPEHKYRRALELRGIALVGFNVGDTRGLIASVEADMSAIDPHMASWSDTIESSILGEKVEHFAFEVFCVPFPKVEDFREAFRKSLRIGHVS